MAFHAGVLQFLAEHSAMERVEKISSVSGGSLLVGLLLQLHGMRWPTSREYVSSVLQKLEETLTNKDLQRDAIHAALRPSNWRFALSRANVLASAIGNTWGIAASLEDVPATPEWSINATTAETGKRARFKGSELRDWALGTTHLKEFPLRDAMAISAAFPGLIGPYVLRTGDFRWDIPMYTPAGDARLAHERFARIHLYDGGVYDNLGLEAFFDAGHGPKPGMDGAVVASDGGAPLDSGFGLGRLNVFRLKRVADIMSDQIRALRVRGLVAFAMKEQGLAAYLRIGATTAEIASQFHLDCPAGSWLSKEAVRSVARYPTNLCRLPTGVFDLMRRHGHESAEIAQRVFGYL